ncbi:MAG: hypothetical protein KGI71_06435 [Patescibacteria group bacterium]|nr:hypothetical protein [Patescibacteria group bacterium]
MKLVTLDFETYYGGDYTLSKMSTTEYLTDPRFRALNFALKVGDKPTINVENPDAVLRNPEVRELLNNCCLVAHHAQFDATILAWHYDIHPRFFICTMSMARPLGHLVTGVSLGALMEHYGLGVKGFLSPDSPPEERARRAIIDVDATYALAKLFIDKLPSKELKLIDWTVRAYTRPTLRLDVERTTKLVDTLAKQKADMLEDLGVDKTVLSSTPQFAQLLESLGVDVPLKKSTTSDDLIPALAKTDPEMQELLEDEDPRIQALCAARLGIKSTGDETRARRMLVMQERLPAIPVYLNYSGARTLRWSGGDKCVTGDAIIHVLRGGEIMDIMLSQLLDSDLVWDGEEFVAHDGLVYQGECEVISYGGVTATPDHKVYCTHSNVPVELGAARESGYIIESRPAPPRMETTAEAVPSSEGSMPQPR